MTRHRVQGLTRADLLVIVGVLAFLAALAVPSLQRARVQSQRIRCASHLKQLGGSFITWALDHHGRLPHEVAASSGGSREAALAGDPVPTFIVMSNELSTPVILACPADRKRKPVREWSSFDRTRLGYFLGLDALGNEHSSLLSGDRTITNKSMADGVLWISKQDPPGWTPATHHSTGNILLSDGSVQQIESTRLREFVEDTMSGTNRLLLP